jgi:hypothetical protein
MDENDKALEYVQHVKDMGDEGYNILNDEAHMLLAKGDLERGLETRDPLECLPLAPVGLPHIPEWTGQDLDGKTILFHAEQGYGDTIMCSGFARELAKEGAKVTLGVLVPCDLFRAQYWCDNVTRY